MKHKRIIIDRDSEQYGTYYFCPKCGSEIVGVSDVKYTGKTDYYLHHSFFWEEKLGQDIIDEYGDLTISDDCIILDVVYSSDFYKSRYSLLKENLLCPVCREPIKAHNDGHFLYLKYPGYFNITSLKFNQEFSREEQDNLVEIIIDEPTEDDITRVFNCLKLIRIKKQENSITNSVVDMLSEYESQPVGTPDVDASIIKSNPEKLKQYIKHIITLESSVYSVKERLEELLKNKVSVDEEAYVASFLSTENLRDELMKAQEAYDNRVNAESYASFRPVKPSEPMLPELKKPGLFNKRKIQEENDAASKAYDVEYEEYLRKLKEYEIELSAFERNTFREINKAEKIAAQRVYNAKVALDEAINNPPITIETEAQNMLLEEISRAKETIRRLIKAKNTYYSLDVIFEKYRNIVALTSFYEYLMSGRCEALEGRDGAYNIYESEVRSNQIISQLNRVIDSLESIKNGQYLMYTIMKDIYGSLDRLNGKTEAALTVMNNIQGDISQISKRTEVIAYNTERAAFYAKQSAELTNSLGFLVAMK